MNVAHQIPTQPTWTSFPAAGSTSSGTSSTGPRLEPDANGWPNFSGGKWNHNWDQGYMDEVKDFVQDAAARGIWVHDRPARV